MTAGASATSSALVQPNSRISEALAAFRRGELARARALAQAQLEAEQGPPEVDHLLGLIDCRDGRLESGIAHLKAALDAQPENVAFRVMLARALVDSGQASESLEVAIAPAEATPAALALWHVRAEAAAAAGDHAAAADAWKILCSARSDDWRAWANYGDALAARDEWEEAANALRQASTLNPTELARIPLRPERLRLSGPRPYECFGSSWRVDFRDGGRAFTAHVYGPLRRRRQALAILDSLRIRPARP